MTAIAINQFAGLMPELTSRLVNKTHAQIAHNCLLWDGSLRPMPQWTLFKEMPLQLNFNSINEDTRSETIVEADNFGEFVYLKGEPFSANIIVGIDRKAHATQGYYSNIRVATRINTVGDSLPAGLPTPTFVDTVVDGVTNFAFIPSSSVTYVSEALSVKPVKRIMGVTFCRQTDSGLEESPIAVIPGQEAYGIMFEGDTLQVFLAPTLPLLEQYGITHIRLYRTVSGLDSGEKVANELDTDWHLVATMLVTDAMQYFDGGAVTTDPMDLYLAGKFYSPQFNAQHFGLTESGYFAMVGADGQIAFSERYLHHAWPTEHRLDIQETVTSAAINDDNIYIGTLANPYIASVAPGEGEQGAQVAARPFSERLPCLPGTMVAAPGGAVYASVSGLVGLSKSGAKVITSGILNAGDILYKEYVPEEGSIPAHTDKVKIERTIKAACWNGKYFGFTYQGVENEGANKHCYIYNLGDDINGDKQFQHLVTMDTPSGFLADAKVTSKGLTLKYANKLFNLPIPGEGGDEAYNRAKKLCYRWKSKKFVHPGYVTLAAAKVIHDCGGKLKFRLYVDCKCVFEIAVCDCRPFRLPSQISGIEIEVELIGTTRIHRVILASSMEELSKYE